MRQLKLFAILLFATLFSAQAQINVNGEFRTRGIVDHGYFIPVLENTNPDFSIDQRTRLNAKYSSQKYTAYISIQDARVWGSDDLVTKAGTWGNSSAFGVHESWIKMKLGEQSFLKIGRQEWNYDNMRLLSYRNWATSALSYDGLLFHSNKIGEDMSLDIGLSYNNNGNHMRAVDNNQWQPEKLKTMNFIHVKKSFTDITKLSLLATLSGKTDTANMAVLGTGTYGVIFSHNKEKKGEQGISGLIEGYYQHGTDVKRGSDGNYKNISAYLLIAELGYRTLNSKLEFTVGGELISGHDYSNSDADYNNTRHSFDLMYGGRLPFYGGYMNHFIIQDSYLIGTKGGGYFDPYLKVKYKLNKKNILEAGFFNPMLTTKVKAHTGINSITKKPTGAELDENGQPLFWEGSLGQYFDLAFTHKLNKEIVIKAGASYALVSDTKNQMVNGYANVANKQLHEMGHNYFGWIMLIVKPNFYTSK